MTYTSAVNLQQKANDMISCCHSESDQIKTLTEKVSEKWQRLMYHVDERHKFVMASNNWFKTADQVSDGAVPIPPYRSSLVGDRIMRHKLITAGSCKRTLLMFVTPVL